MTSFDKDAIEDASDETLGLLEWPTLCEHLARFSSTVKGRQYCLSLPVQNDISTCRLLLEETKEIFVLDQLLEGRLSFQGIHDISYVLVLCSKGGIASGEELLAIAETLGSARNLRRQIDNAELRPKLTDRLQKLATHPELERTLKRDLEHGGRVADHASQDLAKFRKQIQSLRKDRSDRLNDLLRTYCSLLNDNVIAERNGRPVFAVKIRAAAQFPGLVLDSSSSGNTLFMEPNETIQQTNELSELEIRAVKEEQRILGLWSKEVANNVESLEELITICMQLDVALARARYSKFLGGVPPELKEDSNAPFLFKGLRHPLLVWKNQREGGQDVVPISVEVSSAVRVVAITGPNTGGKTVTLKTLGLAVLMSRSGLFLPCTGTPSLPFCTNVFADIGDDQSLEQNLSTFSGHIKRICRILKILSKEPGTFMILLDEIGAGTDPSEGSALAISLLRTLADKARLTVATTHYGELKALKYIDSRFENASVAFNGETLLPTYQLQWGIPGTSNALFIANRLGCPDEVIDHAQELLTSKSEGEVNIVIKGLEEQRQRQQEAAESAAALLARAELLHEQLMSRWEKQSKKTADLEEIERRKLSVSIQKGQHEVRRLISKLRGDDASGETARVVGQRLRRIAVEHTSQANGNNSLDWRPEIGERIRLLALGKPAEVVDISEDGLQLTVLCGVLRSKVSLNGVQSLDGRKPTPTDKVVEIRTPLRMRKSSDQKCSNNTIDVRGLRVNEAEVVVEEFLRKVAGPIWIVHGIGSGKLKRGLREWLSSASFVERVTDAATEDGGSACTIVWPK